MKNKTLALIALALAVPARAETAEEVAEAALEAMPVWDGHNDVPMQLRFRFGNRIGGFTFVDTSFTADNPRGAMQTDLVRLREGHVGAQFWSIFVPTSMPEPEAAVAALEQIDVTKRLVAANADEMAFVATADEVAAAMSQGKIASLMGIEGGHHIANSLAVLRQMYALGVRYMTLTHSANVAWADSADGVPVNGGLSDFGRDVVREMNRLGMIVDLSHVSADTMRDAIETSAAPVIFSHSSARGLVNESRNVPDDVLVSLKDNGGIVMVTPVAGYISTAKNDWLGDRAGEQARLEWQWQGQPDRVSEGMQAWLTTHPEPVATVADLADHIDHIRAVAGIDHIGIGGDYDGWTDFAEGLGDVSTYPALFTELARRGYTQEELEKISGRNMMRVLRAVEAYAASQAGMPPVESSNS